MSIDPCTFRTIVPSRYITFTFPNPFPPPYPHPLHTPLLRIAVLDSPTPTTTTTTTTTSVAAMLVPSNRETDWTFSTLHGHLQLLLSFTHFSRLILVSNLPNGPYPTSYKNDSVDPVQVDLYEIEESLMPLLIALAPRSAFSTNGDVPEIPFLRYEDEVVQSVVLEICEGHIVGEMLVEDVELKFTNGDRDFRRRLRFKRMPNLVQTQMRICLKDEQKMDFEGLEVGLKGLEVMVDDRVFVHPYLTPMVAGISLIGGCLDERIRVGIRPKALCLGVGGGALIGFLSNQLGFEVFGVEEDEVVLQVARKYFGLESSEFVHLTVGDGIKLVENFAFRVTDPNGDFSRGCDDETGCDLDVKVGKFDIIMVDIDSSDATMGTSSPPLEFVRKPVLLALKAVICEFGVLIINVIPPSKSFYEKLINEFLEVFAELYEIDTGNEENFVLIAAVSEMRTASSGGANSFTDKLRVAISGAYIDSIRKISRSAD